LEKCVFAAPSLEILGHTILQTGAVKGGATSIKAVPVNKKREDRG
jgi:hypothetical protein